MHHHRPEGHDTRHVWDSVPNMADVMPFRAVVVHIFSPTRQIEKSIHFLERRSDSAASLPSEMRRHYQAAVSEAAHARSSQDDAELQSVQAGWRSDWKDAVWMAAGRSCFLGLFRLLSLPRRV